ncbi:MAG: DUF1501 domain-containing protein [Verrucomicrobia bacterium]|nr:DUF1501 domain-containing protein [Verrucomicrobiota bacterium]
MKDELNRLDTLSRRRFMSYTAKSLFGVGVAPMLGNTLATTSHAETPGTHPASARNVIYLFMSGGMSHIDTFDTKPGSANQGPVESIKTNVTGQRISEYLPGMARHMNKVALINSMYTTQGAHEQGQYFMHTSYIKRGTISHPSLACWALKLGGRTNETLPGNVVINGGSGAIGNGFLEPAYSPLVIGNPTAGLQHSTRANGITQKRLDHRVDMARQLNDKFLRQVKNKNVRSYNDLYDDALGLMRSSDLKAFDLDQETPGLRAAYGDNEFGQGCLLARRLVEHRVRFVEVHLGGWDTHTDNFDRVSERAAILDQGMSTLLADLQRRGMLEETLVVLATEFGRSPEIVKDNDGRNHHPKAFSCLLAGGGVHGGAVYGRTDPDGNEVIVDKVTVPDFNATIAYALGLPMHQTVFSPTGRPFKIADKGKPIVQLFS